MTCNLWKFLQVLECLWLFERCDTVIRTALVCLATLSFQHIWRCTESFWRSIYIFRFRWSIIKTIAIHFFMHILRLCYAHGMHKLNVYLCSLSKLNIHKINILSCFYFFISLRRLFPTIVWKRIVNYDQSVIQVGNG